MLKMVVTQTDSSGLNNKYESYYKIHVFDGVGFEQFVYLLIRISGFHMLATRTTN